MQDQLAAAFFSAPHKVLGRRLQPLTLRHCFVLLAADNAIASGGEEPTIGDLYQAVDICSRPGDYYFGDKKPGWFSRWWWELRTRKARRDEQEFLNEFIKFAEYMADYMTGPKLWGGQSDSKAKCNWILNCAVGLMLHLGMSEDEAWRQHPGRAIWYLISAMENDPMASNPHIVSEEEEEASQLLDELEESDWLTEE